MKAITALVLLVLSTLGLTSCSTETVQAPKAVATIEHTSQAPSNEDTTEPAPASVEYLPWVQRVLADYDVTLPAGTQVLLTNFANCGADLSPLHVGGCTYPATASAPITVIVSPEFEGTQWGEYILLHEASHALGNWTDECAADQFARDLTGMDYWVYDEQCNPNHVPSTATPEESAAAVQAALTPIAAMEPTAAPQTATQPATATAQQPIKTVETEVKTVEPQTTATTTAQPTPPAPPVPSIPPYTNEACSEFEARAEDGSCVPSNYWNEGPDMHLDPSPTVIVPPHAEPSPSPDCNNLQLGDAHAGIGLACHLDPAKP